MLSEFLIQLSADGWGCAPSRLVFWPQVTQSWSLVQLLSHAQLFATPWTEAHQASLSITNSRSLLILMSIK